MSEQPSEPVVIPTERLSPEALSGLIEEFVTRDGTDYGFHETSLEAKVTSVRRQLERGDVLVVFDPEIGSATCVRKEALSDSERSQ